MVKIAWTNTAIDDMSNIGEEQANGNSKPNEITIENLLYSTVILEEQPRAGRIVPEFDNESIRELIRGSFRIVYQIADNDKVNILTVHHCSRFEEHNVAN